MDDVMTDVGPADLALIKFTGNQFTGEVTPALLDLVRTGTVRVWMRCSSTATRTAGSAR
jgi:hypothetical protein